MDNEIWKPVKSYEESYEVSNLGRVRSKERTHKGGRYGNLDIRIKSRFLSPRVEYGYKVVNLCKNSRSKKARIHRLVAEAFIPNTENKPQIDHINTIRTDNRVENLRWVTPKENCSNPLSKKNRSAALHKRYESQIARDITAEASRKWHRNPENVKRIKGIYAQQEIKIKMRNNPKNSKVVLLHSPDGKFISEFPSTKEAARQTGFSVYCIRDWCDGKHIPKNNLIWNYKSI